MWINGPFLPGVWNDISIFRWCLKFLLALYERVEADDGYRGEIRSAVTQLHRDGQGEVAILVKGRLQKRHETANKRLKQWKCLKEVFRHGIEKHSAVFRAVAVITQLSIENGEPLFGVDYDDSLFNNND